jgi:fucose 4-O-acetylase-like acetyltransferase
MNPKATAYFPGLDAIRGGLILLVVLSHCLSPGIPVFILYSFHMPLFLGISGFLIKRDFIRQSGVGQILQKYFYRMIIPWFLAFVIYYLWRLGFGMPTKGWQEALYPYYHLWFVPALLVMVLTLKLLEFWNIPFQWILGVSAVFCLGWYMLYREHPDNPVFPWFYYLGDKRLYGYFGFFYLGYVLRSYPERIPVIRKEYLLLAAGVSLVVLILFIYLPVARVISFLPYLILNVSLITACITHFATRTLTQNTFLLFCNQQSLAIYLYHYLVILLVSSFITFSGPLTLLLFAATVIATYVTVYFTSFVPFVNKYFFGYTRA